MDAKYVTEKLRQTVHPALREAGFSKFKARRAWRERDSSIDVIHFGSFTAPAAAGFNCTTVSLVAECGVYYPSLRWLDPHSPERATAPEETECQARIRLQKSIPQRELPRKDIWYVRNDGYNLDEVIQNVLEVVRSQGFSWFTQFSELDLAIKTFESRPESPLELLGGEPGSPARKETLRGLRLALEYYRDGKKRGFEAQ